MKTIYILVGPSGSGKDSLGSHFESLGIPELVSTTTRKIRKGEVDGVAYNFVTKSEFDKIDKIEETEYSGNYYCLSKNEVDSKLSKYDNVFAITDVHGMQQIREQYPSETVAIFVQVTLDEMVERMKTRGDNIEDIAKRVSNAVLNRELENDKHCEYKIRNIDLEDAIWELENVIESERLMSLA